MAVLTSAQRRRLPPSAFALPERRLYPIMDRGHARAALGRCAHDCSGSERRRVRAAVRLRYPDIGRT